MIDPEQIKKIVAKKAVSFIQPHMKVGLGSGTTAQEFIKALAVEVEKGLIIEAIAASIESENLARQFKIPINPLLTSCDIYIDGTDEFDDQKNCLKGKGRALFREKIIATMSKHVIILADSSKKSTALSRAPLVLEILPFGYLATIEHIKKLGFKGHIRVDSTNRPIITDNGAYLYDISLEHPILNPRDIHTSLKHIPGVLETGLFFNIVNKIIVGLKEGQVIIYE
jgi:ribose 5-phosphate isomerase A